MRDRCGVGSTARDIDMTLEQAKNLYRAAVGTEEYFDWNDVHSELEQVVTARNIDDAAQVINWWNCWSESWTAKDQAARIIYKWLEMNRQPNERLVFTFSAIIPCTLNVLVKSEDEARALIAKYSPAQWLSLGKIENIMGVKIEKVEHNLI